IPYSTPSSYFGNLPSLLPSPYLPQHRNWSQSEGRRGPSGGEARPIQATRAWVEPPHPKRRSARRPCKYRCWVLGVLGKLPLNPRINLSFIPMQATAGLLADGRHIINRARDEAQSWRDTYRQPIPGKYVSAYTLYSSVRPFGTSTIIGAYDADGPHLYLIEPSGVYWGYHGCAVGKGKQVAKTEIEKLKLSEMTVREAVKEAARMLSLENIQPISNYLRMSYTSIHTAHDEAKDKEFELELSWVCEESNGRHQFVPKTIAEEAERLAKESMNEEMDDD
ncbi:nucleophile aminohydrolase, partial [Jimgerdemannia flammicorona]